MATDQTPPASVSQEDLAELSRRTLRALLAAVSKPDVRASTLAAATKFLSEHRVPQATTEAHQKEALDARAKALDEPFPDDLGETGEGADRTIKFR